MDTKYANADLELILAAQAGDRWAVKKLIDTMSPLLTRIALRAGLDRAAAEDAAQVGLPAVLKALETFDAGRASQRNPRTYLIRAAFDAMRSSTISAERVYQRHFVPTDPLARDEEGDHPVLEAVFDGRSPEEVVVLADFKAKLPGLLYWLTELESQVVVRSFMDGVPLCTLAEELKRDRNSLAAILERALTKLRRVIDA